MPTFPCPEETEPAAVPGNDGLRLDEDERRPPLIPDTRQPHPEQAVEARQPESASGHPFEHVELMP
jgi:hypothetical protein